MGFFFKAPGVPLSSVPLFLSERKRGRGIEERGTAAGTIF